ncbi:MAG: hypothetical protein JWL85_214, partial [Candidatus Saccharibacteria bacterium]|nr:hypothetical protein [Candidatus Saccharibacteria bacterium]
MKLSVVDFSALNEEGGVNFGGTPNISYGETFGLAKWLTLDLKELELEAGKTAEITATINNDDKLRPGGHYGAIMVTLESADGSTPNTIDTRQTLSALVFARKMGGEKYDLKLDTVSHDGNMFKLPSKVRLRFFNPGNVHVVPRGTVKIVRDSDKRIVAEGTINEDSNFMLPETYRQLFVNLRSIEAIAPMSPSKYHLVTEYRYDGLDKVASRAQPLSYTNPKFLLLSTTVIAGLSAAIFLFIYTRKKRGKSAQKFEIKTPQKPEPKKIMDITKK